MAQPTGSELFDLSATQWGKKYRMGAEVAHDMWSLQHATKWDCCLTGESLIYTANRGPVRIDEIVVDRMVASATNSDRS